tara:strand:- start:5561 stop:6667 length:1107 start_codon:yes stop_codon:yes gene_type:complete
MPASTIFQQFGRGRALAGQRELQEQQMEANKLDRQKQLLSLDNDRKGAIFQDARTVNSYLKSGRPEQALGVLSNRAGILEQMGGDTSDTREIADFIAKGDIQGAIKLLDDVETAGVKSGFLNDLSSGGPVSVQSAKILDDGTIIQVLKGGGRQVISPSGAVLTGDAARDAVGSSRDQAYNRKVELKKLDQKIKRTQQQEGLLNDQQKSIQRGNIRRLGELSGTSSGRNSAVKKATKFKLALEKGEVHSGAGRKGLSFVPGVFTSQGQFDEEFNAFAEVAARQTLKASGETRPTDADVQGMKQAMFGIGRDESVNIQLLTDFIKDQHAQTNELDQLIEASKGGNLSNFTFTPTSGPVGVGQLSDEELFK